jgi:predicted RNA binding protein YcfA (HicA-like mRNA interferase family)
MKLRDLEQHLRDQGCRQIDDGGNHTRWADPHGALLVVPSRREINYGLVRKICLQLELPMPTDAEKSIKPGQDPWSVPALASNAYRAEPPPEFSLRRPRWKPHPTSCAALGLSGIAAVAVSLWLHGVLRAWTPNIAVSALTVAATITVIQGITRRETKARIRPRVERALMDTHNSFQFLVEDIVIDYAKSHQSLRPIPNDLNEALNRLLWEHMTGAYEIPSEESVPRFVLTARQFAGQLAQTRERDRDVLEPGLIRAMDDFCRAIRRANRDYETPADDLITDPASMATFGVLQGVRNFAWAFQHYVPYSSEISEQTRGLASSISRAPVGEAGSESSNG